MASRGETHLTTIGNAFATASPIITARPTDAEYDALATGITTMQLRRRWGTTRRCYDQVLIRMNVSGANPAPTVANALVDQNVNEGEALSYQFASNSFSDATGAPLTYSATLSSGAALPGWLTFTAGTRTFSGTAPSVEENTVITVRVTATDGYGQSVYDDFTITIANV